MMLETYTQLKNLIDEVDAKLDSLGDSKAAGKRAKTNELIEAQKEHWEKVSNNFITQLSDVAPEVLIGIYYGTIRALQDNLGKKADEAIEAMIKDMPTPEPLIKPEEREAYSAQRSDLYQKIKVFVDIAQSMGDPDADKMVMPKKRTGAKGPRGPRAISFFKWTVDDKTFDSLKAVAEAYPANYAKVVDLRKAIAETEYEVDETAEDGTVTTVKKKYSLKTPPDRIEFTLPDGKVLVGENNKPADVVIESEPDADADGDEDEDDDSDGE